jgi:deazaflavin-dependent oxidoreductase (nitroreductase family)
MTLPAWLARFNRTVSNPLLAPAAERLPYFGVLHHRGRSSGRPYRTPVNAFPIPGGFVVALTYGPATDWVRNVLVAGGCEMVHRGRRVRMIAPRLLDREEGRSRVPAPIRPLLDLLGVDTFLALEERDPGGVDGPSKG